MSNKILPDNPGHIDDEDSSEMENGLASDLNPYDDRFHEFLDVIHDVEKRYSKWYVRFRYGGIVLVLILFLVQLIFLKLLICKVLFLIDVPSKFTLIENSSVIHLILLFSFISCIALGALFFTLIFRPPNLLGRAYKILSIFKNRKIK